MASRSSGVAALERVEAILANRGIYELAELIPPADLTRGGRRRHYPEFMWLVFEALLSVYGSARRVEAELSYPLVWELLRRSVRQRFRSDRSKWLPDAPMRRHHYMYARNRYLTDPAVFAELAEQAPAGLHYSAIRLEDNVSFVHVAVLDGEDNPLNALAAFGAFVGGISDRCTEGPTPVNGTVVGSYQMSE